MVHKYLYFVFRSIYYIGNMPIFIISIFVKQLGLFVFEPTATQSKIYFPVECLGYVRVVLKVSELSHFLL